MHHKVTILQSFLVPSKHTQTLCGSSRIFVEVTHSLLRHLLAVNREFCKQHCIHRATHLVRVSFLVFVFFNIFHINSFCSQNVTEQFTIINLWLFRVVLVYSHIFKHKIIYKNRKEINLAIASRQQSKLNAVYCLDQCLFHLNSTSEI